MVDIIIELKIPEINEVSKAENLINGTIQKTKFGNINLN